MGVCGEVDKGELGGGEGEAYLGGGGAEYFA